MIISQLNKVLTSSETANNIPTKIIEMKQNNIQI